MDTLSRIYLGIAELEGKIEEAIDDGRPDLVPDYQEELDHLLLKLKRLESANRKPKTKKV